MPTLHFIWMDRCIFWPAITDPEHGMRVLLLPMKAEEGIFERGGYKSLSNLPLPERAKDKLEELGSIPALYLYADRPDGNFGWLMSWQRWNERNVNALLRLETCEKWVQSLVSDLPPGTRLDLHTMIRESTKLAARPPIALPAWAKLLTEQEQIHESLSRLTSPRSRHAAAQTEEGKKYLLDLAHRHAVVAEA